jgi:hypothetical protein
VLLHPRLAAAVFRHFTLSVKRRVDTRCRAGFWRSIAAAFRIILFFV